MADRKTAYREGIEIGPEVYQGVVIEAGKFVCWGGSHGYLIPGADAEGNIFAGIALERKDNADGSSGDVRARIRRKGHFLMKATSITKAMEGDIMYLVDAETFDETNPGNGVICGRLVEFVSATLGWIDIELAVPVAVIAGGALTIADTSSNFTTDTVEAALAQLASRAKKARLIPDAITLEDGTALTTYTADPTPGWAQLANKENVIKWGSHATPGKIAAHFSLPDDLKVGTDVEIHVLARMSGANDTPELTHEAYINAGDTDCAGADDEIDGGVTLTEYVNVIAGADVPAGPASLTVIMNPKDGELGTDDCYIYSICLEYTRAITA